MITVQSKFKFSDVIQYCKPGKLTLAIVCMQIEPSPLKGMTDSGKKIWRNVRNS